MKRRGFLQICGGIGGGALLLLTGCARVSQEVDELPEIETTADPTPTAVPDSVDATKEATTTPTAVKPIATLTVSAPVDTTATGSVRCPRGLLWDPYPGRCRHYRDTNGNGYCDWSEPT